MKYSFIVTYYDRPLLLEKTLESFAYHYKGRDDFDIILLEDKKNVLDIDKHNALMPVLTKFAESLNIIHKEMWFDNYSCPCSAMNYGVDIARGEFIVITNPECAHANNILAGFDEEFAKDRNVYIVSACATTIPIKGDIGDWLKKFDPAKQKRWYQHSKYQARNLNFCTAISKEQYIKTGGFNEEFDKGLGRADVSFMQMLYKAKIQFVVRDDLICLHQEHPMQTGDKKLVSVNYGCKIFSSRFKK